MRQMCFKTHIYLKPLHSFVSFGRKRFIGLRHTAVEKSHSTEKKTVLFWAIKSE